MLRLESCEKDIVTFDTNQQNGLEEQGKVKEISLKEQGNNFFHNGKYYHAINAYTRALESTDPNDYVSRTILLSNRSQCLLELQKYDLAVEDCTKALQYMPSHAKSYFRRGQALELLGNHEAALKDLQVALKLEPDSLEVSACIDRVLSHQPLALRKNEKFRKEHDRRSQEKDRRRLKRGKEIIRKNGFEEFDTNKCSSIDDFVGSVGDLYGKDSIVEKSTGNNIGNKLLRSHHSNNGDDFSAAESEIVKNFSRELLSRNECVANNTSTSSSWSSVSSISGAEDEGFKYPRGNFSIRRNLSNSQSLLSPSSKSSLLGSLAVEKAEYLSYPVRLNSPDCMYYLKTGKCNYGPRCKFNHPPRDERLIKALSRRDCFDFLQFGRCPYGKSCKYNHPSRAELSELGFKRDENLPYTSKSEVIETSCSLLNAAEGNVSYVDKVRIDPARELNSFYLSGNQTNKGSEDFSVNDFNSDVDLSSLLNVFHRTATEDVQSDVQRSSLFSYDNTDSLRHSGSTNPPAVFPTNNAFLHSNHVHGQSSTDYLLDGDVSTSLKYLSQELDTLSLENSESSTSISRVSGHKNVSPQSATPVKKSSWSPVDLASPHFSLEGSSPLLGGFPSVWRLEPSEHVACDKKNESLRQLSSSSLSSFETSTNDSNSGIPSLSSLPSFSYLEGGNQESSILQRRSPLERASFSSSSFNVAEVPSSSFHNSYWNSPISGYWEMKQ